MIDIKFEINLIGPPSIENVSQNSVVIVNDNLNSDRTLMLNIHQNEYLFDIDCYYYNSQKSYKSYINEFTSWKEAAMQYPIYLLLSLTSDNDCVENQILFEKARYKLTFRPNLDLAKKIYIETQTIPIKFIQIIYMFLRKDISQIILKDSENELMSPNPPRFKIKLYDYQAKTISWMRQIESGDIKIKYYKDFYYGIPDPATGLPFCYFSSKDIEEVSKSLANYHIFQDPPNVYKEFKINGGLLADIMGNGKTVTGIAHIFAEHCRLGPSYPPLNKGIENDIYLPSRATLILCPNNIIDQWYGEFEKCLGTIVIGNGNGKIKSNLRFLPSFNNDGRNYRVIKIATMHHLNALNHSDLMNADAVIVSYTMMTNTNHIGKGFTKENGFSEQLIEQQLGKASIPELDSENPELWNDNVYFELERVLPRKLLYLYKWNRIIHDEFHEVINTKIRTNSLLFIIKSLLKARYYWGFSGSSILENDTILLNLPSLLHFEDDWSEPLAMIGINKSLFFEKCVIKNTKRILPALKYVKVCVKPSDEEKTLYNAIALTTDYKHQIRFACYHNLNIMDTFISSIGTNLANKLLSADEIMAQQHETRKKQIDNLTHDLTIFEINIQDYINNLKNMRVLSDYSFTQGWQTLSDLYFLTDSKHNDHNVKVKAALEIDPTLRRIRDIVRECKKELKSIEEITIEIKTLEKANQVYNDFIQNKTLSCPLCGYTSSECADFMVLLCRDYFCQECTKFMLDSGQKVCPCRSFENCQVTTFDSINLANLGSKSQIDAEIKSSSGLSKRLWGSKICDIIDKIKDLTTDPNMMNKIILFAQWDDLLDQIEVALNEIKIESCTVKGITNMRLKAIRTFQESPNCKVILLSSVFGASGINLTEANYVFIVHPFLGDMAEQYEYQAICRAYRTGQKREMTVMHFIREDTYESILYSRREHKDEETSLPKLTKSLTLIKPLIAKPPSVPILKLLTVQPLSISTLKPLNAPTLKLPNAALKAPLKAALKAPLNEPVNGPNSLKISKLAPTLNIRPILPKKPCIF